MIAFLGMGHLGANFVRAMLNKGEKVNVWNRTASKARMLEDFGATAFEHAADAVKGAKRIHLTLKDDEAVNEVLERASPGFEPGVMIIDHTTTSTGGAKERTEQWKQRGYTYLHAPVFMGPQNALESTGVMLLSGDEELIEQMQPELAKMTGKVLTFGTESNRAAGIKLMGNLFLLSITAGLSDVFALAKAMGVGNEDVTRLFANWNPGTMIPVRVERMTTQNFSQPSWELNMARKDARLMIEETDNGKAALTVTPVIAAEMDKWIARGHGSDDWTVIAKDNV